MQSARAFQLLFVVWLCLSSSGGAASATTTFEYSSSNVVNEQNISIFTPVSARSGLGEIVLTGSGPNSGQTILAWCLDLYDDLARSGTYQVGLLTTAGSGGANPTLTAAQIGEIGALMQHGEALINTSFGVSAAIQLAIWEVEYGSHFSSNGVNSSVSGLAATYLTDVTDGVWAPNYNVSLLTERNDQALGFLTPLPSTWSMMLLGIICLGLALDRRDPRDRRV